MPTYQYACTACGEQLEAVQKFSDDPLTVCPACGGLLRKLFSSVGIVFKGSGFYRTDSRKGSVDHPPVKPETTSKPDAAKADSNTPKAPAAGNGAAGSSSASTSGSSSGSTGSSAKTAAAS